MIGVVGCGKQGEKHLSALRALGVRSPLCADIDATRALAVSDRFGARAVTLETLLAEPDVQGIVVATPTASHRTLVECALNAGKPVLCEKPLAASLAEATYIAAASRSTGRFVMTGFIYRYAPAFVWADALLRPAMGESPLGEPVHALLRVGGRGDHEVWKHARATQGGVIHEMMVHMFDLALWLFGPLEGATVTGSGVLRRARHIGGSTVAADADDYMVVSARAANGAPVLMIGDLLTAAFTQYVDAQFDNGSYFGSIQHHLPTQVFLKEARGGLPAGATRHDACAEDLVARQMAAFIDAVRSGRPPAEGCIEDAIAVMRLVDAVTDGSSIERTS